MPLEPGLTATVTVTVADADTASSLGSGEVDVLGTPRVVALVEQAAVEAIRGRLDPAETSVGMRVQLDHLAPTGVGAEVTAEATLEKVQGRRLVFTVAVNDARGLVAAGRVTRVIVETERFLQKAN
ncbi:MAG TPA: hotdog domain-containing protein [Acidimicrobiales bacterium]|nr:hotdog domain-containing protein [Acidimicrobiales bacterium]